MHASVTYLGTVIYSWFNKYRSRLHVRDGEIYLSDPASHFDLFTYLLPSPLFVGLAYLYSKLSEK